MSLVQRGVDHIANSQCTCQSPQAHWAPACSRGQMHGFIINYSTAAAIVIAGVNEKIFSFAPGYSEVLKLASCMQ